MKPSTDREAVTLILEAVVKAGRKLYSVTYPGASLDEGVRVRSVKRAIEEVMAVDDAYVVLSDGAWLRFVLGNDPEEVLCDHTVSLTSIVNPVVYPWWGMTYEYKEGDNT